MISTWNTQLPNPSMSLDFSRGILDSRITFTRASAGTQINSSGIIETINSNLPRFDYDPATLAPKGLLIEEQRTNLLTYSEQFDNAAWGKALCTVAPNQVVAPDGTLTGDLINFTAQYGNIGQYTIVSGTTYTFSFWCKISSGTRLYHIVSGGGTIFGSFTATTNWTRFSITFVGNSQVATIMDRNLTGFVDTYLWGAQLEAGSFPTSYIPTTSATVTRAADNASMVGTNFSSWYNQSEGTVYCASDSPLTTTTAQMNWYISDGSAINMMFNRKNTSNLNATAVVLAGVTQGDITSFSTITADSTVKSAFAYKLNDLAISVNGASVGTDLAATIPTVDRINLGQNISNGQILNGHIQSIKYYPTRLPNNTLQWLTS